MPVSREYDEEHRHDRRHSGPSAAERHTRRLAIAVALCAVPIAVLLSAPATVDRSLNASSYLVFHIVAELMSVIVSFAVFAVGWYGYRQATHGRALWAGFVFLAVGLLDLAHTLSYKGMPGFLTVNTVSKASTLWIMARLVGAIGLAAAAFVSQRAFRWPGARVVGLVSALLVAGLAIAMATRFASLIPPMYVEGSGQTTIKIALEVVVMALYALTIYLYGSRLDGDGSIGYVRLGLVMAIFSELSLCLYIGPYDILNMLGHAYKFVAYFFIFRGLFVMAFQSPYRELERARDQLAQSFSRIGDALAVSLDLDKVLDLIAELTADMLGAGASSVMLMRDGALEMRAHRGLLPAPSEASFVHACAAQAIAGNRVVIVNDTSKTPDTGDGHRRLLEAGETRSVVSAPIVYDDVALGVVEAYSPMREAFDERDADLLMSFSRQAAAAIRNSMAYERERNIAETLQRSLLPDAPAIPGVDIAVRYVPAEDAAKVGGDLYDVFALDEHRIALVVGDVCGHGLKVASVMAMIQYSIRGFLIHGMAPGDAMSHANLTLSRSTVTTAFVTVFVGILDTRTMELQYANAGHPMPLVLGRSGCPSLEAESDLPIGIDDGHTYATQSVGLGSGLGLLLYTDGITEARREGPTLFGTDRLSDLCSQLHELPSGEMLDRMIDHVRTWAGRLRDDTVLLVVK